MSGTRSSADVVNLRMARKRKARETAEAEAARRRGVFGVTKADKQLASAQRGLAERGLDAHRIIPSPGDAE